MKSTSKTSRNPTKDLVTQMIDYLDTQAVNGKSVYQDWEDFLGGKTRKRKQIRTRFSSKTSRPIP